MKLSSVLLSALLILTACQTTTTNQHRVEAENLVLWRYHSQIGRSFNQLLTKSVPELKRSEFFEKATDLTVQSFTLGEIVTISNLISSNKYQSIIQKARGVAYQRLTNTDKDELKRLTQAALNLSLINRKQEYDREFAKLLMFEAASGFK